MEGRIKVTAHGREQTALAAWRQVTGGTNAQIVKKTGLADRTVVEAMAGRKISAGTAALIAQVVPLPSPMILEGEQRREWVLDFKPDGTVEVE